MLRRTKILILTVLTLGIVLTIILVTQPDSEPSYIGKNLSEWLFLIATGNERDQYAADEAIRHIGTNGIPVLLKCIAYDPRKCAYSRVRRLTPSFLANSRLLILLRPLAYRNLRKMEIASGAVDGFLILGASAKSAVPELRRYSSDTNHMFTSSLIDQALKNIAMAERGAMKQPTNSTVDTRALSNNSATPDSTQE